MVIWLGFVRRIQLQQQLHQQTLHLLPSPRQQLISSRLEFVVTMEELNQLLNAWAIWFFVLVVSLRTAWLQSSSNTHIWRWLWLGLDTWSSHPTLAHLLWTRFDVFHLNVNYFHKSRWTHLTISTTRTESFIFQTNTIGEHARVFRKFQCNSE